MDFSQALRMMRARANVSQTRLAELSGLSQSLISALEAGTILPSEQTEIQLRDALDWTEACDEALAQLQQRECVAMHKR